MKVLNIEASESTPKIYLDKEGGKFEIVGKSFPEEVRNFYAPVYEWLTEYVQNPNDNTLFEFKMDYFNSASSLVISEILNLLNDLYRGGRKVTISWCYHEMDDDMLEAGEEYSDLIDVPFVFNSIPEI